MKKYLVLGVLALLCAGCDNMMVRHFGGTGTLELEEGQKLVNITWKGEKSSLWVLTRQRSEGEQPTTYEFREISEFGILEGKIIINER